jgi:hypothetical protein
MRIELRSVLALALGMALLAGCGSYEPAAPPPQPKGEGSKGGPEAGKKGPPKAPKGARKTGEPEDEQGPPRRPPPKREPDEGEGAPKTSPPKREPGEAKVEQRKAEFGVGAKGHDYGPGALTTPLSVHFTIQERIVFEVKIPKAMQLFKATENRAPKSQEEFMQKIVKDNDIALPELPFGDRYVYDPKAGELMVQTTRASAQPAP